MKSISPKTAFRWKSGLFEYNRVPCGLSNAPTTFQRMMDRVLEWIRGKFVMPYLDDIIIYSNSIEEHISHIEVVIDKLKEAGIIFNKSKCKFFKEEVEILGTIIKKGVVKPNTDKVKTLNNFSKPKNIKEPRSFLGLANYCRDFIPFLSEKTAKLNDLFKGQNKRSKEEIAWNKELETTFGDTRGSLSEETHRSQPEL